MTQHFEQNKNMVQTADGQIHLLDAERVNPGDYVIDYGVKDNAGNVSTNPVLSTSDLTFLNHHTKLGVSIFRILYTTDPSLTGVKQLPREMFVREGDHLDNIGLSFLTLPQSLTIENDVITKRNW